MRYDDAPTPPTLGWLARDVTGVFCWCNRSDHNDVVPFAVIIAKLGPSLPFPMVHGRLRCQACGSTDIHARPDWPKIGHVANHWWGQERQEQSSRQEKVRLDIYMETERT